MKNESIAEDWRDGFLFVGNQLSLDLLNTRLVANGEIVELLPDVPALVRWLAAAGLIAAAEIPKIISAWQRRGGTPLLNSLKAFRERLRAEVFTLESAGRPGSNFIGEVNRLLNEHPLRSQLVVAQRKLIRRHRVPLDPPHDVFAAIADATASLLTDEDSVRIRKCESCVVHFLDTSKKGSRRWCSMRICGNRLKVAAYGRRKRENT